MFSLFLKTKNIKSINYLKTKKKKNFEKFREKSIFIHASLEKSNYLFMVKNGIANLFKILIFNNTLIE